MFHFFYKKTPKRDIECMSDDELADETFANNNILDSFDEAEERYGLTQTEIEIRNEINGEYEDMLEENFRRTKNRNKRK